MQLPCLLKVWNLNCQRLIHEKPSKPPIDGLQSESNHQILFKDPTDARPIAQNSPLGFMKIFIYFERSNSGLKKWKQGIKNLHDTCRPRRPGERNLTWKIRSLLEENIFEPVCSRVWVSLLLFMRRPTPVDVRTQNIIQTIYDWDDTGNVLCRKKWLASLRDWKSILAVLKLFSKPNLDSSSRRYSGTLTARCTIQESYVSLGNSMWLTAWVGCKLKSDH
jgi:hypothetical protein